MAVLGRPGVRDQARAGEQAVNDQCGDDHRHEHQRDDAHGVCRAVVLAVDRDDREHDSGRRRMNAITPAKLMPPDHRTAASGMLPTEQTKLSAATKRPDDGVLDELTAPGAWVRKRL